MGALRGSTRLIALGKITVLARLLSPIQFGLFGVASLALALLEILTDTGINAFLIQEKKDITDYLNTAWIVSIVRGILISLALLLLASPVALFFKSPESTSLLALISLVPFIRGFINPAIVQFQKNLEFHKEFIFRLIIFAVDATVTLVLALLLHSAVSLVWGMIAAALLETTLSHVIVRPRPTANYSPSQLIEVVNRGKWITLSGIFEYIFQNLDDIVVGKLLGTYSLGLYQMAYKISTLPVSEGGEVLQKVTFPVFAKIGDDVKRTRKAFLKVVLLTCGLVLPFGLVIFFFPSQIVLLFLGNNWLEIVPVLRILVIFGLLKAVFGSSFALFLANKKQAYISLASLVAIIALALSIYPLVKAYGIYGAGISALVSWIFAAPVVIYFLLKLLAKTTLIEKQEK